MSHRAVSGVPPLPARQQSVLRQHPVPPQDGEPAVPAAVRLFSGFAGFGAGSVNLAICSSFFAGAAGAPGPAEYAAGGIAGLWGAALLSAAVVYLAKGSFPDSRAARAVLMLAAAVHAGALATSTPAASGLSLSHLAALLLTLMIIAAVAWLRRNSGRHQEAGSAAPPAVQPGRLLLAAFAGAVLVAGITTPGLAASTAGQFAVPHGEHGGNAPPGGHHQR